jgi:hypothetical protein
MFGAQRVGSRWIPVLYRPERVAKYLQVSRFPRKAKPTENEALEYARKVDWYRQRRENNKSRKLEALCHPRYSFLEAAESIINPSFASLA